MTDQKNDATEYMWKGEPCPNPEKGWITDSRDNRLTRLGNRNAFGKIIQAHNREVEIMHQRLSRAQPVADDAGGGERPREIWVDHTAEAFTDDVRISQGLTRYIRADVIRQPAAADNRGVDVEATMSINAIQKAAGVLYDQLQPYMNAKSLGHAPIFMAYSTIMEQTMDLRDIIRTTPEDANIADSIPWDIFPAYLIDHYEGEIITEEFLQMALSRMIREYNPHLVPATQQPEHDKTGGES